MMLMPGDILDNRGRGSAGWSWPPVHPEGRKFALIAALACVATALMAWETVAWPLGGLTVFILAFFRDPSRVTPRELTADDGTGIKGMDETPVTRVSIFMSVFDVHINRAPIGGTIRRVVYIPGKFVNADLDKASEDNERQHLLIEGSDGLRIGFTQIAGLVARRIVAFVREGDVVEAGQRVGLIRFGSRVDVYLPDGVAPRVLLGQRAIAGETILGIVGLDIPVTGISQ